MERVIKWGDVPLKGFTVPIFYLCSYGFKYFNTVKIISEEYFMNACVEKLFEL